MRAQNPNIEILEMTVKQLGGLADEMVFLGGCATGLLITDKAAPPIRVTRDVDTIVQAGSLAEYQKLSEKLRKQGFKEDTVIPPKLKQFPLVISTHNFFNIPKNPKKGNLCSLNSKSGQIEKSRQN